MPELSVENKRAAKRKYRRTDVKSVRIFVNLVAALRSAQAFVFIRKEKSMDLYRGEHYGVFTGPNGYYIARMTPNKKSYYEAVSGGDGWSAEVLQRCNTQASELDSMAEQLAGIDSSEDRQLHLIGT